MANWAYVENGQVKDTKDVLPNRWRNISGLDKSANDLVFLKNLGWFPVERQHQDYDPALMYVDGFYYLIGEDRVFESLILTNVAVDSDRSSFIKDDLLNQIRQQRDALLSSTDWTQLVDIQSTMSDNLRKQWVDYRQELRDLPSKIDIDSITSIDDVIWPVLRSI